MTSLDIKNKISQIDSMLSPENLYMDGEADAIQANRFAAKLMKQRAQLVKEERKLLNQEYLVEQGKIDFNG